MVTMTDTNSRRTAHHVLADERLHGEVLRCEGGDSALSAVTLTVESGAVLCVFDEYDAWEIGEGAVHVGYVWATYADEESALKGDCLEHDGGLTERELLDAVNRARALAQPCS